MWRGRRPARPAHPDLSNLLWEMIEGGGDPGLRMTIQNVIYESAPHDTAELARSERILVRPEFFRHRRAGRASFGIVKAPRIDRFSRAWDLNLGLCRHRKR